MSLFAPFALLAFAMVLGSAAVGLARHGPLGIVAATLLLVGTAVGLHRLLRRTRRWWRAIGRPTTQQHPNGRADRPTGSPTSGG